MQGRRWPLTKSKFESLRDILEDDWQEIWNHTLAVGIRKREYVETRCKDCPQLQICGGGCPMELQKKDYICAETIPASHRGVLVVVCCSGDDYNDNGYPLKLSILV